MVFIPRLGKVGPVGDHVSRQVPMFRPVPQRRGERLSKDVLQVIGVISAQPGFGVGSQTVGLREQVRVGATSS